MKTNPALVQQHVREDLKTDRMAATDDYEATGAADFTAMIEKIDIPTLIVRGADDLLIPESMTQFLHEKIKGSRLEVILDAGHVNMIEKPDELNKIILGFTGK